MFDPCTTDQRIMREKKTQHDTQQSAEKKDTHINLTTHSRIRCLPKNEIRSVTSIICKIRTNAHTHTHLFVRLFAPIHTLSHTTPTTIDPIRNSIYTCNQFGTYGNDFFFEQNSQKRRKNTQTKFWNRFLLYTLFWFRLVSTRLKT